MQGNDTLRNILISCAVFFLILWAWPKLLPFPPQPQDGAAGDSPPATSPVGDSPASQRAQMASTANAAGAGGSQPTGSDGPVQADGTFAVVEADTEQTIEMGSLPTNGIDKKAPPSPYRMRLELSNVGASVVSATMTDHAATLNSPERYQLLRPIERDDGNRWQSLAVEKINVDGVDVSLADRRWHASPVEACESDGVRGQRVRFQIEIRKGDEPALRLTRTFELPEQPPKLGRHDLWSALTVENLSTARRDVFVTYRGGVGVQQMPDARMDDRYIDSGLWDGTRVTGGRLAHSTVSSDPGQVGEIYSPAPSEPQRRLSWAATANTYFTAIVAPRNRNQTDNADYLGAVSAIDLDGSAETDDDVTIRFVTRREALPADHILSYPADLYLGEKDGDAFREVETYKGRNYYFQISQGFGACTFGFLVELMIWMLNSLQFITRDYGLAIIGVVLIVRTLLHPITKKGQINMVRMQQKMGDFAPKVEELKKKFGNDKARLQQETMKLYREHGINPATQMLGCLPLMLQMPIWIALFLSLSNNILLRHQPFILFPWVDDLTAADALYTFATPLVIPVLGWTLPSFNLLPLLVALFMYIQQKLQPKPKPNPNATEQQRMQQEMMQKMMPMMSIMMLIFFYKMPSGLNLYIMFSSLFGAIEQHRIRKHIKEQEAAGTLHKPAPAAVESKRQRPGKMSFLQKLQKMAEEAQKAQSRRPAKGKPRR